ncbi:MAG: CooT family nickel-binding protein [Desulfobacteraceae bacterium]|nr:CooT family nickel-binding protein [Desulfobacteraceae bacterium]
MCESAAYILRDGEEELVLESIDLLENRDGHIELVNLYGEQKTVRARLKVLSLVDHKIILEPL